MNDEIDVQIDIGIWPDESDIGRIYIKGYLYPISYPKIAKKGIPLSFFWVGYVEGYNILILGIY
jgi:hypothetical protein